jgi:hypothetical protein
MDGMTIRHAPLFGLLHVIPDKALAAWGGRFIVTQDGRVDLPYDRQGGDRGPHTGRLLALLGERFPPDELFRLIGDLLQAGTMDTRHGEDFILYHDEAIAVHANTNGSGGYCYVTAFLWPEGVA